MTFLIVVFALLLVGAFIWGAIEHKVMPKVKKAVEPDPKWDEKTKERFSTRNAVIFLLALILLVGIMNKCCGSGRNPDSSPYDEPLFK